MLCLLRLVGLAVYLSCFAFLFGRAAAQEQSVSPGINKPYENPDVPASRGKFEREGRDAYDHRQAIVAACELTPGQSVADIGAGTGLFTRLFAPLVGPQGRVYAVDIAENFVRHIEKTAQEQGLGNIVGVVCDAQSVNLPAASVDVAFICDTYHHFEFPQKTLATLFRALRPGGRVIVVDYQRLEGVSSDWTLKHVRAGKEEVTAELIQAGFHFVDEKQGFLKESYLLRFEKRP